LVYLESVPNSAWLAPNVPLAQKSFLVHPMILLGCEAQVEGRFSLFSDSANLDARQLHGLRRTLHGSKIILDAHDGTHW
jgi:hypothetical protein